MSCGQCSEDKSQFLYQQPVFQDVAGDIWRPGSLDLTLHGIELCAFAASAHLLEVGSGSGATASFLRSRYAVTATDIHPLRADILEADVQNLPFAAGIFDGCLAECVLSLTVNPRRALAEMARVTRLGGKLLLADITLREAGDTPVGGNSCLAGAVSVKEQELRLGFCGWKVLAREDHRQELTELAAQLLWRGEKCLGEYLGIQCQNTGKSVRQYTYTLWVCEKMGSVERCTVRHQAFPSNLPELQ